MARIGLIHGLGGTAATMAPLTELLAALGHETVAVTLPGHGSDPADLAGISWADWLAALPGAEVLIGQSMGGALALAAAASREHRRRAVVAINTPAADPDALDALEWRRSRGHEWIDGPPLADGEAGYTRFPITALTAMVEGLLATDLAAVEVPVLLVNGVLDDVVDPASAGVIAASLGGPVTRLLLPGSGHVATFGPDLALLVQAISGFV